MFNFSWLKQNKIDLINDPSISAALLLSPEQIETLIEEKANDQRHQLFQSTTKARLIAVMITLAIFLMVSHLDLVLVSIMACYIILAFGLLLFNQNTQDYPQHYALFIGFFDVFLLGYLATVSSGSIETAILLFSVLLSAMLLPPKQFYIILLSALIAIIANWLSRLDFSLDTNLSVLDSVTAYLIWFKDVIYTLTHLPNFQLVLVLVVGFTIIGMVANRATDWAFKNEITAQLRYRQLQQVLGFNNSIIEHLKSGIIVMTVNAKIISYNQRAAELLNVDHIDTNTRLRQLSTELARRYQHWLSTTPDSNKPYQHNAGAQEISVSFSAVDDDIQNPTPTIILITLESLSEALQQAQEAKLTALGRLTAGVAHEIRNPLSAINSAAQLLEESDQAPQQQKLSSMIQTNIQRANQIISDILGLFQETKSKPKLLPLEDTLKQFSHNFAISNKQIPFDIQVESHIDTPAYLRFDSGQLEQVLWNLCYNAIKYANAESQLLITLHCQLAPNRRNVLLDVIDNGKGISQETLPHIFEPFYSEGQSTGLGLYLVKELCSANQANITYIPRTAKDSEHRGACFRITGQVYFSKNLKVKTP